MITGAATSRPLHDGDPAALHPGTALITDYGAEQVTIDAHASRSSELVLSDTYYPGWTVTVNGRPAAIDEVDYLLRGVHVPAGNDRIVFTYDPSSFPRAGCVSLVASVLVVGGARRRAGAGGASHVHVPPRRTAIRRSQVLPEADRSADRGSWCSGRILERDR